MVKGKGKSKTIIISVIVGILLIGIVGGVWYFLKASGGGGINEVEDTNDDGSASLTAEFLDSNGNPITPGLAQSFFYGNAPAIGFMALTLKVAYTTGNSDLINVRLGTVSSPFSENVVKDLLGKPQFDLLKTQTTLIPFITTKKACTTEPDSVNCDTKENCISNLCWINLTKYESARVDIANPVIFSTTFRGDYIDAYGQTAVSESGVVSLTYDIRGESCSDATKYNTCVFARTGLDADKPRYCTNTTATGSPVPTVNKASICGCPSGFTVTGDTCTAITCTGGTALNTPSSYTGTATVGGIAGVSLTSGYSPLIANYNITRAYCDGTGTLIFGCATLIATPSSACGLDANGGQPTSCLGTAPRSICQLATYSGSLTGCIPDCVGKATGASDGCVPPGVC